MWSSRFFWKLFGTYICLSLVAGAVFVMVVSHWLSDRVIAQTDQRLHDMAVMLREIVANRIGATENAPEELQGLVRQLGHEARARMTVIALDGTVLADSQEDPANMENHKNRTELIEAASGRIGRSQRASPTLDIRMMYVALRVERNELPIALVRTAMPTESIDEQISSIRWLIMGVALAVSVVGLLLTYGFVSHIVRPLRSLTEAANLITAGQYEFRAGATGSDEFGTLAEAFQTMSREISRRVSQVERRGDQLATVLASMVEGVVVIDERQYTVFLNHAAKKLLGIAADDPVGQPLWKVVRHPMLEQAVAAPQRPDAPQVYEIELSGEMRRRLAMHVTKLPGEPSPGLVLVFHDVTALRRLEQVRQEFVANASHELKTPLASIKAYAETLREGALYDASHNLEFVERIEFQAERLHRLILDLLRLAQVESGRQAFEIVEVPLSERMADWVQQYATAADAKSIELVVRPSEEAIHVKADLEGLQQIVDNLLDNAIKYTPEGGTVTVRWETTGEQVKIAVEDTGIGIAQADQERIFERFYRVDKARSREMGGTGLGLSIVKHLAQAFGGSVGVESYPGRGSTFSVHLPLA